MPDTPASNEPESPTPSPEELESKFWERQKFWQGAADEFNYEEGMREVAAKRPLSHQQVERLYLLAQKLNRPAPNPEELLILDEPEQEQPKPPSGS